MPQKDIEIILMRQLASYLAIPTLIADSGETLIFCNGSAEEVLGCQYKEIGEVSLQKWSSMIPAITEEGSPLPMEDRPLLIALQKHQATHRAYWIRTFNNLFKKIKITAFPLKGMAGRYLGAVSIFWEVNPLPRQVVNAAQNVENLKVSRCIEVILMRQLSSYLAMSIFLVDPVGNLLFYNESAERLLGHRYNETGEMPFEEWSTIFTPTAEDGSPISPEDLPLSIALQKYRADHRSFWIRSLDGIFRRIAVTAFPLEGEGNRHLGAVAIFWEEENPL
ncbi:MAG TPA: PAS domain-containing protein [Candidatus Limnocylindrales bacterium]|nr:PAS domain-containing protein [Candidatus Limnocylindrales bacterium]